MLFFALYSIHFFFSLFFCFCSSRLQYNGRQGRAGQGVTGSKQAGTATRDSNEGQARGAGGREEEGDGWAGVLGVGWRRGAGEAGDGMAGGAKWGT